MEPFTGFIISWITTFIAGIVGYFLGKNDERHYWKMEEAAYKRLIDIEIEKNRAV